jgi:type IV pilus assembly protein PilZ
MQLDPTNEILPSEDTENAESGTTRRMPVKIRVEYGHIEDFLVDYTSNHTIGGMFIKTDRPLAVGANFLLRFQLPGGGRAIETEARVRWTLPVDVAAPMTPGMGVCFEELSAEDKSQVELLLENWR